MMRSFNGNDLRLKWFISVVAVLGLFISLISAWLFYRAEEKAVSIQFQKDVDEFSASFYRELITNFEALHALEMLFKRDPIPDLLNFTTEANIILNRHTNIQALEWVPRIPAENREAFLNDIRKHYPLYTITHMHQSGGLVVEGKRQEYFPVYYVAPIEGNISALGFDLASEPNRLSALKNARETAKPQISAAVNLVQEVGQKNGVLAFLPVYHTQNDKGAFKGFVLGVYLIDDIFHSVKLNSMQYMRIRIFDQSDFGRLLYESSIGKHQQISNMIYGKQMPEIWGRKWSLLANPSTAYLQEKFTITPYLIFLIGCCLTLIICLFLYKISNEAKEMFRLSRIDGLTGIPNRRCLDEHLAREWARAIRNGSALSFAILDIDYFKNYNDAMGHIQGDKCIQRVAHKLVQILMRPSDMVARYGGEEFALVLPDTNDVKKVAERCRVEIESLGISHPLSTVSEYISISIGICRYIPQQGEGVEKIVQFADDALYTAKSQGRNRVVIQEPRLFNVKKRLVS